MKVQIVEKECTAKVGISVEFSNSEIDSLVRIALKLDDKIEAECKEAHAFIKSSETGAKYNESDGLSVKVDLKTLTRISWLLDKITNGRVRNPSDLFNEADGDYLATLASINNREEE